MKRGALILFALLALVPLIGRAGFQQQRAQIGVTVVINVTPNPLVYRRVNNSGATDAIIASAHLRNAPPAIERAFEAQQLHFAPMASTMIAAAAQKGVKVEAEVSPNPNGTMLTSDAGGYQASFNVTAGTPATFPCAYHVSVSTTITNWTLKHGLSGDFTNNITTFPGGDVANNSYLTTPLPTSTPFVVYANDGGTWTILNTNSGNKTYCVDLTLSVPGTTAQGTYASNAIYTLYY